jgi:S1-C subfamily serine protease
MSKPASRIGLFIAGMLVVVVVVVVLMATGVISAGSEEPAPQASAGAQAAGDLTPLQIYKQDAAGVVEVHARFTAAGSAPGAAPPSGGLGSGFLVSKDGSILTNAHVIMDEGRVADSVVVVFRGENGANPETTRVDATVVGTDENTDVALLKIDPAQAPVLHPLPLGKVADVRVGEPVVAIGNPLGLSFTLTSGIVSATGRNLTSPNDSVIPNGIQTDAAINSGNSGGPLIDSAGYVIGINTQIITVSGGSQGLGFAVAIDTAVRVMDQLKATGTVTYAYLGVTGQTLNPEIAQVLGAPADFGLLVTQVTPGSPAAVAGIRGGSQVVTIQGQPFMTGGDVITEVDGKAITSSQDLAAVVAQHQPGDTIAITLLSGGQTKQVQVTLAEQASGA